MISFEAEPPSVSEIRRRMESSHLWLVVEEAEEVVGQPATYSTSPRGLGVIVPVLTEGRVVGTLDVESDCRAAFGTRDRRLAEALAQRLAPLWSPRSERG